MTRWFGPILAFVLSFASLRVLLSPAANARFLDHPNERSLHASPVARTGGVAIMLGTLAGMALAGADALLLALTLALTLLSLLDDWKGLSPLARLVGHLAVAGCFAAGALSGVGPAVLVALVVAVAWTVNLYNFMDGADGLAGGMTVFGFATYAIVAWILGAPGFALINLCVAASALAFLCFNFPPARIFMGDAGSIPLGFLAAALGALGWNRALWPLWFPAVVFAPFIVDATVTLLRRALRGERIWQAHRSHYYQRQVLMGWSHRQVALAEYLLMLMSGCAALIALWQPPALRAVTLASLAVIYVALVVVVDTRWRAHQEA
jgi:UDP-N-acetylmuramyl pentapeptide phosphotransferase/UDP-N-acetylglucosamine-1-phosphate transferase